VEESEEEGNNNSLVGLEDIEDTSAAADVTKVPDKSASLESEDDIILDGVKVKQTLTSADVSAEVEKVSVRSEGRNLNEG